MDKTNSDNSNLQQALSIQNPLLIVGTPNALIALIAKQIGFHAIYLSGAGVANCAYGLPDLAVTHLGDVLTEAQRITDSCDLPLLVDIDTGFGHALNIRRTIQSLEKAGVSGIHIEDQISEKRCGHRPNKMLVSISEMQDRLKAALDARKNSHFTIMARTDALSVHGLENTLERIRAYTETGADMIFLEGAKSLADYQAAKDATHLPILANCTEFGVTPLFTQKELAEAGVNLILYPLSAMRMMAFAAQQLFQTIQKNGSQAELIHLMQTRSELYELLNYQAAEQLFDLSHQKTKGSS